jgi:glyoxylase-like metal-dependent hydrolase (beta-lactamase superfamily II)/ferredoxin
MAWMPSSKPDAVVAHGEIDLALHAILEAITFAVLEWGGVMARLDRRHPGGARGDWFIDDRCIGCAASATIAPDLIDLSSDGQRFVFIRQPTTDREIVLAQQAAEVCPTRSIGTTSKQRWAPHHPVEIVPGVWRTGWNSPDAVGANAFVVQRSEGNVLIEGPRFTRRVRDAITSLGGLRSILLTHADDVGDAARYADAFGAEVIIHELDADAAPFATNLLQGRDATVVAGGVTAIPTPGYTAGHVMYLVDDKVLFSGDSLDFDPDTGQLGAYEEVCWWSWEEQVASLDRLAEFRFTTVVPSHGGISPPLGDEQMNQLLRSLVAQLRSGVQPDRWSAGPAPADPSTALGSP